jgi:hypothetical protein
MNVGQARSWLLGRTSWAPKGRWAALLFYFAALLFVGYVLATTPTKPGDLERVGWGLLAVLVVMIGVYAFIFGAAIILLYLPIWLVVGLLIAGYWFGGVIGLLIGAGCGACYLVARWHRVAREVALGRETAPQSAREPGTWIVEPGPLTGHFSTLMAHALVHEQGRTVLRLIAERGDGVFRASDLAVLAEMFPDAIRHQPKEKE